MIISRLPGGKGEGAFTPFTYTGNFQAIAKQNGSYEIRLLSSGTLKMTVDMPCDIFLVGGGGGGGRGQTEGQYAEMCGGGGGGGGYTLTETEQTLYAIREYAVVIGAGGKATSGTSGNPTNGGSSGIFADDSSLSLSVSGGKGAKNGQRTPGAGGSGGGQGAQYGFTNNEAGYSDGNGSTSAEGQGTTTRAFGETGGTLYAGGGGGSGCATSTDDHPGTTPGKAGGSGGGGKGGTWGEAGKNGTANTGGGGGGSYNLKAGDGGSGIVIIRRIVA